MKHLMIEFDNNEAYHTGPPAVHLGTDLGYASLEGYRLSDDGFVVMDFGSNRFVKIPVRRLLRITEG
jgi:hypothetical protein